MFAILLTPKHLLIGLCLLAALCLAYYWGKVKCARHDQRQSIQDVWADWSFMRFWLVGVLLSSGLLVFGCARLPIVQSPIVAEGLTLLVGVGFFWWSRLRIQYNMLPALRMVVRTALLNELITGEYRGLFESPDDSD